MSVKEHWYIAAECGELKRKPLAREMFGEKIVLARDASGKAFALIDRCAHRNMALSLGKVKGGCLECPYHGWKYDRRGMCTDVPSLKGPLMKPSVAVRSYPVRERDGFVWVYAGERAPSEEPFAFPRRAEKGWISFLMKNSFEGSVEQCLENFLDCPHTVFVHRTWFRSQNPKAVTAVVRKTAREVEAEFEDEEAEGSVVSALLFPQGMKLKHTDRFIYPSTTRVDYRFSESRHFIITSHCVPIREDRTFVYTVVTFQFAPWGPLVRLLFEPLCRIIIAQDVRIIKAQTGQIRQFGGPKFIHTPADLFGPYIQAMRGGSGNPEPSDSASEGMERRVRLQF